MLKCKDGTTTWSWLTKKVSLEMYWVQAQKPFLKKKKSEHNDTVRDRATD